MVLFIIIIVVGILITIASSSKDKKSKKKLAENEELLKQIPDINYKARKMTGTQKALNLWPRDVDMLDVFQYNSNNRQIYLQMKDGRYVSCALADLDVEFGAVDRYHKQHYIVIRLYGKKQFSFYEYAYIFTDTEWNDMFALLTFAGTTRNVSIMSKRFRNTQNALSKMNTFMNILKHLS